MCNFLHYVKYHCNSDLLQIVSTDISQHALVLLQLLKDLETTSKKATLIQLIDLWRSPRSGKEVSKQAKSMSRDQNEAVVAHLMYEGLLQLDFGHTAYSTTTYLKCSPQGVAHLSNPKRQIILQQMAAAAPGADLAADASQGAGAAGSSGSHHRQQHELYLHLDSMRRDLAGKLNVFPHAILHGQQLEDLAAGPLVTENDVERVLGKSKTQLYGKAILDAARHAESAVRRGVHASLGADPAGAPANGKAAATSTAAAVAAAAPTQKSAGMSSSTGAAALGPRSRSKPAASAAVKSGSCPAASEPIISKRSKQVFLISDSDDDSNFEAAPPAKVRRKYG